MNVSLLRRLGLAVVFILVGITCFMMFSYSIYQSFDSDKVGNYTVNCEETAYLPLRLYVGDSTQAIKCSWAPINNAVRIMITLFAGLFAFSGPFFASYRRQKWFIWLSAFIAVVMVLTFFSIMILDANDIRISSNNCEKNPSSLAGNFGNATIDCAFWFYIWMTFADTAMIIVYTLQAALLLAYGKFFLEDDFTQWDLNYEDTSGVGYDTDDPAERAGLSKSTKRFW